VAQKYILPRETAAELPAGGSTPKSPAEHAGQHAA